jgi:hypothetical protein
MRFFAWFSRFYLEAQGGLAEPVRRSSMRPITMMFLYDACHLIECVRLVAISPGKFSTQKGGIDMTRFKLSGSALIVAAVAAISVAGGTAGFAAELPSYEVSGFPISPVQAGLLGTVKAKEQSPAATVAASPHQLSVLTPHRKRTAATAPSRTEAGRAIR